MSINSLIDRLERFSIQVVQFTRTLPRNIEGRHFASQLLRSGTSITANFRACRLGQSRAAYIAKISISIEEADETYYWLKTIKAINLSQCELVNKLIQEAHEITSILISIRKKSSPNSNRSIQKMKE